MMVHALQNSVRVAPRLAVFARFENDFRPLTPGSAVLSLENSFWTFSLDVYARPGVAQECLALQAGHGIDVNAMLFCAWAGAVRKVRIGERHVAALSERVDAWQQRAVLPLRTVRQALKEMLEIGEPVAALRKAVAAAELKAEQIEQAMLFADAEMLLAGADVAPAEDAVPANLVCFLRHHGADAVAPAKLVAAAVAFAAVH
jgi:uncharacterized protein (TIGR02444 family)